MQSYSYIKKKNTLQCVRSIREAKTRSRKLIKEPIEGNQMGWRKAWNKQKQWDSKQGTNKKISQ